MGKKDVLDVTKTSPNREKADNIISEPSKKCQITDFLGLVRTLALDQPALDQPENGGSEPTPFTTTESWAFSEIVTIQ